MSKRDKFSSLLGSSSGAENSASEAISGLMGPGTTEKKAEMIKLTFQIEADFHTRFKTYASAHRMKMVDIFKATVEKYMTENP